MLKFMLTTRQIFNLITVILFTLAYSNCYCQKINNVDNSDYYFAQDTVVSEGLSELVIEHGFIRNNNPVGLWIGLYADSCRLFSAKMYTGKENYEITPSVLPILVMSNNSNTKKIIIRDSEFNFVYSYSCDSLGRIGSRYFENSDSTVYLCYHKNGTLSYYNHSDYMTEINRYFDENGKLIDTNTTNSSEINDIYKQYVTLGKNKNNLPHGIWKTYKNSKLVKIERYKNGNLLSKTILY